jgi:putative ABC transport system permease protein
MTKLALRNLFHDRVRLLVTLTGVVFAVVLMGIQIGLFLGFVATTANLIDHSGADLWIASSRIPYIEMGVPFSERKLYQVRAVPGIERAEALLYRFTQWRRPDGAQESVAVVGFDLDSGMGGPWNVTQGAVSNLRRTDTVMIDDFYRRKLGVDRMGDSVEIRNHRARVAGFTSGIRTFTTSPLIFTSFRNAHRYTTVAEGDIVFILAKARPGLDLARLKDEIRARVDNVDVCTTREFSWRTSRYWMFGTGAGAALIAGAVLGLGIGFVVVAQTIYAATVDHIREFGTLKAMGASNLYIYRIILKQAGVSAVLGYAAGMAITEAVAYASRNGSIQVQLPREVAAGILLLTVAMCMGAAMLSIFKATRIDPAIVFKA